MSVKNLAVLTYRVLINLYGAILNCFMLYFNKPFLARYFIRKYFYKKKREKLFLIYF